LSTRPPANTEQAQYNLAYPVAAALIDGEVGPRQVMPPRLFDETIINLLSKITAECKPEYESAFPAKTYAEVELETLRGETYCSGRMQPRWEPPDALPTDGELQAKFDRLVQPVIGKGRCQALNDRILRFEDENRAKVLVRLCSKNNRTAPET
jgi:2-methylcitrate dehydratase PrpD